MLKPQEKYEEVFSKMSYSNRIQHYYDELAACLPENQREVIDQLADSVYKAGYLDGFRDALFFADMD